MQAQAIAISLDLCLFAESTHDKYKQQWRVEAY